MLDTGVLRTAYPERGLSKRPPRLLEEIKKKPSLPRAAVPSILEFNRRALAPNPNRDLAEGSGGATQEVTMPTLRFLGSWSIATWCENSKPRETWDGYCLETIRTVRTMLWWRRFGWQSGGYAQRQAITRRHRDQDQRADQNLHWISRLDLNPLSNSFALRKQLGTSSTRARTEQKWGIVGRTQLTAPP